jgi:tetratricopeptide (TPR) repeat protein
MMKLNGSRGVLVAVLAGLVGALWALEPVQAQEEQSSSGRARVLVAVFQPDQGVDGDFGKEIAKKIRERVDEFDLLTPVSGDEVEQAAERFDLDVTAMDLISWRQLASRLNAQLIIYGDITRGGSADGYTVDAMFIDANRGDTTSVPAVEVSGDGGDEAEQVASSISEDLGDQVRYLRARLNCQEYLSSDQLDDAVRNCDEALSVRPENPQALYLRGRIAVEQEEWDEAIDYLSQAVERSSSHEDALQSLAFAHAQAGNRERSVELYREYLEFNPGAVDVRLNVAYNLASAGAYSQSMKIIQDGIQRDSTSASLWKYLGDVAIRSGTAADQDRVGGSTAIADTSAIRTAVEAYRKYAELQPDSVDAGMYRNMVGAYMQIGSLEEASEQIRDALDQIQDDPGLWAIRADLAARQKNLDQAVSAMDSVVALDSTYRRPYFKRGVFKLRNGDQDGALQDFEKAVEAGTDPDDIAQQLFATGHKDYYKQGRFEPAAAMFETALEFAREEELGNQLHFWAGYSHFRRGEQFDQQNKEEEACGPARRALEQFQQVPSHLSQAGSYQRESQKQLGTAVETYIYRQEQIIKKSCG